MGNRCEWVRAAPAHHAAFSSFSLCRSGTSDAEIRVMAAEEGLGEDPLEVPALLQLVRRAPGPEVRPPGEAGSSKSSHLKTSPGCSASEPLLEKRGRANVTLYKIVEYSGSPGPSEEAERPKEASGFPSLACCTSHWLMIVEKRTYAYCMTPPVPHCCSHG